MYLPTLPTCWNDWLLPRGVGGPWIEAHTLRLEGISVVCTSQTSSIEVILTDPAGGGEFRISFDGISQFKLHDDRMLGGWVDNEDLRREGENGVYHELELGRYRLELVVGRVCVEWSPGDPD